MNGVRGVSNRGGGIRPQEKTVQSGGQFTVARAAIAAEPAIAASAAISGLIGLQDEAAPARRDQAARRGSEMILHDLAKLQIALLGGHAAGAVLALRDALAYLPQAADPQLNSIVAAIRLRAGIELARRGQLGAASS